MKTAFLWLKWLTWDLAVAIFQALFVLVNWGGPNCPCARCKEKGSP